MEWLSINVIHPLVCSRPPEVMSQYIGCISQPFDTMQAALSLMPFKVDCINAHQKAVCAVPGNPARLTWQYWTMIAAVPCSIHFREADLQDHFDCLVWISYRYTFLAQQGGWNFIWVQPAYWLPGTQHQHFPRSSPCSKALSKPAATFCHRHGKLHHSHVQWGLSRIRVRC